MLSRRRFLAGASAAAILCSRPELAWAWIHGSAASLFNGGKSQAQSNAPYQGDFPFINLAKTGDGWFLANSTSYDTFPPFWLDANGYPKAGTVNNPQLAFYNVSLPPSYGILSNASNPMIITWEGNSTLNIGNAANTFVSGSTVAILNGYGFSDGKYHGRYLWYPTAYDSTGNYSIHIGFESITDYVNNLAIYAQQDEAGVLAGEIFSPRYLSVLRTAKFGVFRFMDWTTTNGGSATTWATRKTYTNPSWGGQEYRAVLYAGVTTSSSNDYSLTPTGTYVWNGPLGNYVPGGAPVHNQTMHISFNADATLVQNSCTIASYSPLKFNWTAFPLANGDQVGLSTNQLAGTQPGINYYVVNKTANDFQVSLTAGGAALTVPSSGTTTMTVTQLPTLNLNGTGKVAIKAPSTYPLGNVYGLPQATAFGRVLFGTVIYDSTFNSWLLFGGGASTSMGITNGVPIEVCMALCLKLGMHPHWTTPVYCLDPVNDYVTQLAQYNVANAPSWMIPHYEANNEFFNNLTPCGGYANSIAGLLWNNLGTVFDWPNWLGKVTSTMGQALAAVYNISNLGTKYEVMVGPGTDGFGFILSFTADYLASTEYVAQAAVPQSGYTKTPASQWTSAMLAATYITPYDYGTYIESQLAWDWWFTSAANPTQQTADLNAYVDSLQKGLVGTGSVFVNGTPGQIHWPAHGLTKGDFINLNAVGSAFTLPTGSTSPCYVGTVIDADHFATSASQGGADLAFSGTASGTFYISTAFTLIYENVRYLNMGLIGQHYGVNKLFAYEGGFSPDTSDHPIFSAITGVTNASQCVLTLPTTVGNTVFQGTTFNTAAAVGMALSVTGISAGPTALNCKSSDDGLGSATFTAGSADIAWGLGLSIVVPGQLVMFRQGGTLPPNLKANWPYFVIATNLSSSNMQISATKGGSAIVAGGTGTYATGVDSGWRVTAVNNTTFQVNIDVDSTSMGAWTSGGFVTYTQMNVIVNTFRGASFAAPHLYDRTLDNYNNFVASGGLYPSQYTISGPTVAAWRVFYPDIYSTQSTAYTAIVAFNA